MLILIIALTQPFFGANQWLIDQLFTQVTPSNNIVIIGIDDQTLDKYGRLSDWPRDLHAIAISNLSDARAKVIGFDVLFVDSSPGDQSLANAITEAGNTVLSVVGIEPSVDDSLLSYDYLLKPIRPLNEASNVIGHANITPDPDGTVRRLPLIIRDSSDNIYPSLRYFIVISCAISCNSSKPTCFPRYF